MNESPHLWTLIYACQWCQQESVWSSHMEMTPAERSDYVERLRRVSGTVLCEHCNHQTGLPESRWTWLEEPLPQELDEALARSVR